MENKLSNVGVIGRFKPLHNGGELLLESICDRAERVIIGIGSSNKYNLRNPFTAEETKDMINVLLRERFSNYDIIEVPDFAQIPEFANGQEWKKFVIDKFKVDLKVDYFVSGNDFVRSLLEEDLTLIHPGDIVPKRKHLVLRATRVRYEMATYQNWQALVPKPVVEYLEKNELVDRFRSEFGLATIAYVSAGNDFNKDEDALHEKLHARESA